MFIILFGGGGGMLFKKANGIHLYIIVSEAGPVGCGSTLLRFSFLFVIASWRREKKHDHKRITL